MDGKREQDFDVNSDIDTEQQNPASVQDWEGVTPWKWGDIEDILPIRGWLQETGT